MTFVGTESVFAFAFGCLVWALIFYFHLVRCQNVTQLPCPDVQYWTVDGSKLLFETLPQSEFTLSVCVLSDGKIRVNGTEIKLYISTYDEGVLHVLH